MIRYEATAPAVGSVMTRQRGGGLEEEGETGLGERELRCAQGLVHRRIGFLEVARVRYCSARWSGDAGCLGCIVTAIDLVPWEMAMILPLGGY